MKKISCFIAALIIGSTLSFTNAQSNKKTNQAIVNQCESEIKVIKSEISTLELKKKTYKDDKVLKSQYEGDIKTLKAKRKVLEAQKKAAQKSIKAEKAAEKAQKKAEKAQKDIAKQMQKNK
ncbi:MAG: hypothetical protein Q4F97_02095 [Bacteroidales bacterium]|nr:hypothetical protein [Bacteroidales bacterium]